VQRVLTFPYLLISDKHAFLFDTCTQCILQYNLYEIRMQFKHIRLRNMISTMALYFKRVQIKALWKLWATRLIGALACRPCVNMGLRKPTQFLSVFCLQFYMFLHTGCWVKHRRTNHSSARLVLHFLNEAINSKLYKHNLCFRKRMYTCTFL